MLTDVQRQCGRKDNTKHYLKEKEKINKEYEKKQKRLAEIKKRYLESCK